MSDQEFVNFEKALNELKLSEDALKRLVSEGEIRAIRGENNTMKFRKEEIERLKTVFGAEIHPRPRMGGDVGDLAADVGGTVDPNRLQPVTKRAQGQAGVASAVENVGHGKSGIRLGGLGNPVAQLL